MRFLAVPVRGRPKGLRYGEQAHKRLRTADLILTKNVLYRLSYVGGFECRIAKSRVSHSQSDIRNASVGRAGLEPAKALSPADLQSAPFAARDTDP